MSNIALEPSVALEKYKAMLAARGFKIGDFVVDTFRTPHSHQFWVHPFWVGVIEEPSTDKAAWNTTNSEADYCVLISAVRVRYLPSYPDLDPANGEGFTHQDGIASLRGIMGEHEVSPHFTERGPLIEFASLCGLADEYRETPGDLETGDNARDSG